MAAGTNNYFIKTRYRYSSFLNNTLGFTEICNSCSLFLMNYFHSQKDCTIDLWARPNFVFVCCHGRIYMSWCRCRARNFCQRSSGFCKVDCRRKNFELPNAKKHGSHHTVRVIWITENDWTCSSIVSVIYVPSPNGLTDRKVFVFFFQNVPMCSIVQYESENPIF